MSLCLGPCEVSVSEMVSAYTVFANHGIRTAPMFVSRIEDNEGNTIATFQPRMNEVISADNAMKMLTMLMGVVDNGTAGDCATVITWKDRLAPRPVLPITTVMVGLSALLHNS